MEPHDEAYVPCPDEEYYAEILKVHSSGKADIQDLEEAADPEHGVQFNRHSGHVCLHRCVDGFCVVCCMWIPGSVGISCLVCDACGVFICLAFVFAISTTG